MRAIRYRGRLAAITTRRRVFLLPSMEAPPPGDPVLRFVGAKCLYCRDVARGVVDGPYSDERADKHARERLIPTRAFWAHANESEEALAVRFGAPIEEIRRRRAEIPWAGSARVD
jgi:hypothetical protein